MHMFPTSSSSGDKNLGDLKSVIYVSPTFKCPYLSYFKGGGGGGGGVSGYIFPVLYITLLDYIIGPLAYILLP